MAKLYKKIEKSRYKPWFFISTYRQLEYLLPAGYVIITSEYIDGFRKNTFLLQKPNTLSQIPTDKIYKERINHKKIQDVTKIVTYIPNEYKEFDEEVIIRPKIQMAQDGESEGEQ